MKYDLDMMLTWHSVDMECICTHAVKLPKSYIKTDKVLLMDTLNQTKKFDRPFLRSLSAHGLPYGAS